jgi:ABC-type Na+ efflux pump permease subunit
LSEDLASVPLVFEEPIYGNHDLTFTDFMAPGIILTIVHSMALGYSAMIIIMERNEGLLDRTWVAGVTPGEFALAHFLVSLCVNLLQVIVTLVFMIVVFQVSLNYTNRTYLITAHVIHYFRLAAVARQMPVNTARRLQMQGAHPHLPKS